MATMTRPAPKVNPTPASNPRETWPAWTDQDRWATGPDPDGPGATDATDFEPTSEEDAWWMGFGLGIERLDVEPPAALDPAARAAFLAGHGSGFDNFIGEMLEYDAAVDASYADLVADGRITDHDLYRAGAWS